MARSIIFFDFLQIGQITVEKGKTVGNPTVGDKPGIGVYIDDETDKKIRESFPIKISQEIIKPSKNRF